MIILTPVLIILLNLAMLHLLMKTRRDTLNPMCRRYGKKELWVPKFYLRHEK